MRLNLLLFLIASLLSSAAVLGSPCASVEIANQLIAEYNQFEQRGRPIESINQIIVLQDDSPFRISCSGYLSIEEIGYLPIRYIILRGTTSNITELNVILMITYPWWYVDDIAHDDWWRPGIEVPGY